MLAPRGRRRRRPTVPTSPTQVPNYLLPTYLPLGSPASPSHAAVARLRVEATAPCPAHVAVAGGRRGVLAAVAGPRLRRAHRAPDGGRGGAAAAAAEGGAAPPRRRPVGPLLGAPPPGLAPRLPRRRARRRRRAPRATPRRPRHLRLLLLHPVRLAPLRKALIGHCPWQFSTSDSVQLITDSKSHASAPEHFEFELICPNLS